MSRETQPLTIQPLQVEQYALLSSLADTVGLSASSLARSLVVTGLARLRLKLRGLDGQPTRSAIIAFLNEGIHDDGPGVADSVRRPATDGAGGGEPPPRDPV